MSFNVNFVRYLIYCLNLYRKRYIIGIIIIIFTINRHDVYSNTQNSILDSYLSIQVQIVIDVSVLDIYK